MITLTLRVSVSQLTQTIKQLNNPHYSCNMYTGMDSLWAEKRFDGGGAGVQLPESPRLPMEFLSRSWSASALQICKALSPSTAPSSSLLPKLSAMGINNSGAAAPENAFYDEESAAKLFGNNTFCFASSATSQMVLERIMAQSVSLTSLLILLTYFLFNFNVL